LPAGQSHTKKSKKPSEGKLINLIVMRPGIGKQEKGMSIIIARRGQNKTPQRKKY